MIDFAGKTQIDRMAIIGCGDILRSRVLPAQRRLSAEGLLQRTAYLDIFPGVPDCLRTDIPWQSPPPYFRVGSEYILPKDDLAKGGWIGPDSLVYIATPTAFHVPYANDLSETGCRIAVSPAPQ